MTEESFMWNLNIFQLCFPFCIEMDLAVSDGGGWLGLPQEMDAQKVKTYIISINVTPIPIRRMAC